MAFMTSRGTLTSTVPYIGLCAGAEIVRQKNKKASLRKLFIYRYDIVIIVQCDGALWGNAEDFMREGA